ncbi:Protein scd2/ral3 [Wickerhamiella sorbophila]|uniref:Protein scd2/ral3 n=1 Tax=Wickerhamiella sorbophila TaxID=45607 RepID=A0A2T0FIN5_9ASCO|nr:Protein scd2/ral3 [Wickerhamiella sorbophila]PRT54845.1 Protein scd2/ral3 [Wickerhamiella sorbophila]
MLKGLFKGEGKRLSHHRQRDSKNEIATITPKLIIRALYDYKARNADELGFSKEDFLYVVDLDDPEWYVACNPLTNSSGLVPISYFEVIQRPEHIPTRPITEALHDQIMGSGHTRNDSGLSDSRMSRGTSRGSKQSFTTHNTFSPGASIPEAPAGIHGTGPEIIGAPPQNNHAADFGFNQPHSRTSSAIYGVVLYDFTAERADELEAQSGESIVIIAQSNEEWFVAKPIGRLGGPGLIPVSYVQLREVGTDEVVTDVADAIRRAGVPQVEEWKRRAAEYKASSIPLGRFEQGAGGGRGPYAQAMTEYPARSISNGSRSRATSTNIGDMRHDSSRLSNMVRTSITASYAPPTSQPGVYVVRAGVERFAMTGGRYWYLVVAEMSNGMFRNLCRYYQDFYDFQIKLLEEFPEESGRTGGTRTLPFMPGPLTVVTHSISSRRRANLDEYVRNLIRMPPHISRSPLIQQLFALREGDIESDTRTSQMPHPPTTRGDSTEMVVDAGPDTTFENDTPTTASAQQSSTDVSPTATATSPQRPQSAGLSGEHVKIKVFHGDELVAIRIPAGLPFEKVYQKIEERIGFAKPQLHARQDFSDYPINTDADFQRALQGKKKIVMFARAEDSTF